MRVPTSGRAAVVLLTVLVAVGGTAGCGRLAERREQAATPAVPAAGVAATGAGTATGTAEAAAGAAVHAGPTVDPGTVAQVEQQVDAAQQFLDGAEAQLGQDGR